MHALKIKQEVTGSVTKPGFLSPVASMSFPNLVIGWGKFCLWHVQDCKQRTAIQKKLFLRYKVQSKIEEQGTSK